MVILCTYSIRLIRKHDECSTVLDEKIDDT